MSINTHKIVIGAVVVLALVLGGLGLYHYQHSNKGISLQTALVQRDAARAQLKVANQKTADVQQVAAYNASQDKAALANVCASLKAVSKVANPNCK